MALRSLAKRPFLEVSRVRVHIGNWDYLMGMKDQSGDFTTHIQRPSMLRWMPISNGAKQVLGKLPDRRRGGLHLSMLQVSARSKFNAVVAAYISRRTSRQLPNAAPPWRFSSASYKAGTGTNCRAGEANPQGNEAIRGV
jgi:hypothetical protein